MEKYVLVYKTFSVQCIFRTKAKHIFNHSNKTYKFSWFFGALIWSSFCCEACTLVAGSRYWVLTSRPPRVMIISEVRSVLSVVTVVLNKDDNNVEKKLLTLRPPRVMKISEVRSVHSVVTVLLNKDDICDRALVICIVHVMYSTYGPTRVKLVCSVGNFDSFFVKKCLKFLYRPVNTVQII